VCDGAAESTNPSLLAKSTSATYLRGALTPFANHEFYHIHTSSFRDLQLQSNVFGILETDPTNLR
jgi:hypothetical protein